MSVRRPYAAYARVALLVVLAMVVGGCVAPAFDEGAYHQNGVAALKSALSQTRTSALALQARLDGRVTAQAADTMVTDCEDAIGPIEASYENVDPASSRQDPQRMAVTALLGSASAGLTEARIAVRRGDVAGMRSAMAQLDAVSDALERAGQRS